MRLLLLSAYDASSHQRWREGLVRACPNWDWTVLALPPRFFSWRLRGNPLYWSLAERKTLEKEYDLVVATSMVDLPVLRGLVPSLSRIPTVVYFHENQFVYPVRDEMSREVLHFCIHNLYNGLCADRVLFNSHYNRNTFLQGASALLKRMPDFVPKETVATIEKRSEVLPVPVESSFFVERTSSASGPMSIVWNHRWEHDKAPERFFRALQQLRERGVDFRLHVVGQQFRKRPECFTQAQTQLKSHIDTWGFLPKRSDYLALLNRCDIAVSTALHEFQGLALLEAAALGCRPVAPDRLAYQDWVPSACRYPSFVENETKEVNVLTDCLQELSENLQNVRTEPPVSLGYLSWEVLGERYQRVLRGVANLT